MVSLNPGNPTPIRTLVPCKLFVQHITAQFCAIKILLLTYLQYDPTGIVYDRLLISKLNHTYRVAEKNGTLLAHAL